MNTNYQVGYKVRAITINDTYKYGTIIEINPKSIYPIVVKFDNITHVYFLNDGVANFPIYLRKLEVIGHIGEDIALAFANYCIGEGYSTNAKPENFKRFLETYKPQANGKG